MITKQCLKLMIIFQVWLCKMISKVAITKTNQVKDKSWRRRIRFVCKVVGALWFSCIILFTYALKSSKSYFVLNFLKFDDFIFSTKTLWVDPPTQPIKRCKKPSLSSRTVVQLVNMWTVISRPPLQPVNVWTIIGRGPVITCQTLNAKD